MLVNFRQKWYGFVTDNLSEEKTVANIFSDFTWPTKQMECLAIYLTIENFSTYSLDDNEEKIVQEAIDFITSKIKEVPGVSELIEKRDRSLKALEGKSELKNICCEIAGLPSGNLVGREFVFLGINQHDYFSSFQDTIVSVSVRFTSANEFSIFIRTINRVFHFSFNSQCWTFEGKNGRIVVY